MLLTVNSDPFREQNYRLTLVTETVFAVRQNAATTFSHGTGWGSQKFRPQSYVINRLMILFMDRTGEHFQEIITCNILRNSSFFGFDFLPEMGWVQMN
jgi:hypothetical protein